MEASAAHLKRFGLVTAALLLAAAALGVLLLTAATPDITLVQAAAGELKEWVLVANYSSTLSVIDPATDEVYGPFLAGQLGLEGIGTYDITVTPDGKTALISNFGDSVISFVDVSSPISPSFITSVTLPMFAEDIAMAPNGQFAMVTDAFSDLIAVLDVPAHTLAYTITLPGLYANSIEIARGGTAVAADYFTGRWISLYPDATGQYTVTGVYSYSMTYDGQVVDVYSATGTEALHTLSHDAGPRARPAAVSEILPEQGVRLNEVHRPGPINVSIAPDGQTLLSGDVRAYNEPADSSTPPLYDVAVYRITSPGVLTFSGVITEMTRAGQSIAFSPDGHKAYMSGSRGVVNETEPNHLSVLDILAPGVVRLNRDNAADIRGLPDTSSLGWTPSSWSAARRTWELQASWTPRTQYGSWISPTWLSSGWTGPRFPLE